MLLLLLYALLLLLLLDGMLLLAGLQHWAATALLLLLLALLACMRPWAPMLLLLLLGCRAAWPRLGCVCRRPQLPRPLVPQILLIKLVCVFVTVCVEGTVAQLHSLGTHPGRRTVLLVLCFAAPAKQVQPRALACQGWLDPLLLLLLLFWGGV
jgi:hypothetical protein